MAEVFWILILSSIVSLHSALLSRMCFDFLNLFSYDLSVLIFYDKVPKSLSYSYSLGYTVIVIKITGIVINIF